MIKLKEILTRPSGQKGFTPPISSKDIGKYVVVYKDENTLVKGTRLYDTKEEAQKLVNLINDANVIIKQIGFGRG